MAEARGAALRADLSEKPGEHGLDVHVHSASPAASDRASQHPWSWNQRLIRSILEVRRDEWTRPTLGDALKEREKIRRAEWMN